MSGPVSQPLVLSADPTVIVYAVRWALGRRGSHAAILLGDTIRVNAFLFPTPARATLMRDITGWLDGAGITAAWADRAPWVDALSALEVAAHDVPVVPAPVVPCRRRGDDGPPSSPGSLR